MSPSFEFGKGIIDSTDEFVGMILFPDDSDSPNEHPCPKTHRNTQ